MQRRTFIQTGFGALVAGACSTQAVAAASAPNVVWIDRTFDALGTTMNLKLAHQSQALADKALAAAIADIHTVEDQMSLFRTDSALAELNRTGVLRNPHPDLVHVLNVAQDISRRSNGAFDATVQPLWLTYAGAHSRGQLPSTQEVAAAVAHVGWKDLHVSAHEIRLARSGMGVTLNGIAPGFAADKVRRTLQRLGVQQALIGTGEWSSLGHGPTGRDWTLGVDSPRGAHEVVTRFAMQGHCVATSADDECTFTEDHLHHHIMDPHTGYSPLGLSSVTVLAPLCILADAITKVIFMSDFDTALPLAQAWNVEVLVIDKNGRWQATKGLPLVKG